MNAKDIRSLSEAYMEVYAPQEDELDEAVKGADPEMRKVASSERRGGDKRLPPSKGKGYAAHAMQRAAYMDKKTKGKHIPGYAFPEEVDVYDIILSHLLDEGYAETEESAEAIMVNMSEEWRDSIMLDEGVTLAQYKRKRQEYKDSQSGRRSSRVNLGPAGSEPRVERDMETRGAFGTGEYGGTTKNPKKLRKQRAMGELTGGH